MRLKKNINHKEQKFAIVDLCSGAGGLSLGFQRVNKFKIVFAVEYDPVIAKTYHSNFPITELIQDKIENVSGAKLVKSISKHGYSATIVIGGLPCQPYCQANHKNNGRDHPFASTLDHFIRLLGEVQPNGFLFENVTNFSLINNGELMHFFTEHISAMGYQISSAVLNSKDFNVPQSRKRLFISGVKNEQKFDIRAIKGEGAKITIEDAISDLPLLPIGGGGSEITVYSNKSVKNLYQKQLRSKSHILYNHWCSRNRQEVTNTMSYIEPGYNLLSSWEKIPQEIKKRYKNSKNLHYNIYKRLEWDKLSPTIVHPRRAMLLHPKYDRILSVREAARIQSFPDSFRFFGGIDSQYQQVANAVPPNVAESIANFYAIFFNNTFGLVT